MRDDLTLHLPPPADVADDPGLPLRSFDKCLASTEDVARAEPLPFIHPQGPLCAAFLPATCRYMADPDACRAALTDELKARIDGQPNNFGETYFPNMLPDPASTTLRDLALQYVNLRLAPYIKSARQSESKAP